MLKKSAVNGCVYLITMLTVISGALFGGLVALRNAMVRTKRSLAGDFFDLRDPANRVPPVLYRPEDVGKFESILTVYNCEMVWAANVTLQTGAMRTLAGVAAGDIMLLINEVLRLREKLGMDTGITKAEQEKVMDRLVDVIEEAETLVEEHKAKSEAEVTALTSNKDTLLN